MGIVALVVLSVTVGWTLVTGGLGAFNTERSHIKHYWFESGRALKRMYEYQPPERKSVAVDISGMAQRTADLTHSTKRDRSKPFPRLEVQITPEIVTPIAPVVTVAPTPLRQGQIEEIPLAAPQIQRPPVSPEKTWSLGRRVQFAIKADNSISRSAQLTLRAVSMGDRVTLGGIVLDQEEKDYIGAKAEAIAGAGRVDNRLTVL